MPQEVIQAFEGLKMDCGTKDGEHLMEHPSSSWFLTGVFDDLVYFAWIWAQFCQVFEFSPKKSHKSVLLIYIRVPDFKIVVIKSVGQKLQMVHRFSSRTPSLRLWVWKFIEAKTECLFWSAWTFPRFWLSADPWIQTVLGYSRLFLKCFLSLPEIVDFCW